MNKILLALLLFTYSLSLSAYRYQPGKTKQLKTKPPKERLGRQQEVAAVSKTKKTRALLKKR